MALIPQPYEIPLWDLSRGIENESIDRTMVFDVSVGATVINAYGLDADYGLIRMGTFLVESVFSPNIPAGGLGSAGAKTYVY